MSDVNCNEIGMAGFAEARLLACTGCGATDGMISEGKNAMSIGDKHKGFCWHCEEFMWFRQVQANNEVSGAGATVSNDNTTSGTRQRSLN